jgi:NADPH:quinone reductase-like Zn-dependent oxidoreductase
MWTWLARSGADRVVDYTREDFVQAGQRYDVMIDMAGNRTLSDIRRVLVPKGILVAVGGPDDGNWIAPFVGMAKMALVSAVVSQTMAPMLTRPRRDDLAVMRTYLELGKVNPVIDRTYPLAAVPDAIRYLETGHARGKVVITV